MIDKKPEPEFVNRLGEKLVLALDWNNYHTGEKTGRLLGSTAVMTVCVGIAIVLLKRM